jgi:YidC/Oxa1 family membrane protein insertase
MKDLQWRAMAALVISLAILFGWEYFMAEPAPKAPAPQVQEQSQTSKPAPAPLPAPVATIAPAGKATRAHQAREVVVTTGLYRAVFSEQGARLKSFQLLKYREVVDKNSPPKELVHAKSASEMPLGFELLKPQIDSAQAVYTADTQALDLHTGPPSGSISFELTTPEGVRVVKRFEFRRDLYRIDLRVALQNATGHEIEAEPALSMTNAPFSDDKAYSHEAAVLVGDKVDTTLSTKLPAPKVLRGDIGWVAYDEPFFVAAVAPGAKQPVYARLAATDSSVMESLISPPERLAAGGERTYAYSVYYGPKEIKTLEAQGMGLDRVIQYGWFDIIAKPLMVTLNWVYGFVHNYGLAIILLTVILKLLFWPLSQKGMRSMRDMQKIQPKMAKLKEKYKNDTAKLNQEMLDLYRTYKVNPMGGCLPMVLQIPVFFALYRVLQYSIELRHAPFMLWINDLSVPDRLNIGVDVPYLGGLPVLTLLMGISMWLQQKMTPSTGDPTQAKMMQLLPVVFTFMFIYFPSGLVLYWLTNNILSIGQQYYVNRTVT